MLNMNTTRTLFFNLLLLSEISLIIILKIQNWLVLLKSKSLNLLNQVLMVRLMCGIKLLTRLRVGLSHLRDRKFRHNFQDSLDPFHNCGLHIEITIHFFLHCTNYSSQMFFIQPK